MDHVMRRVLVTAAVALLAGCSLFSDTQAWIKPGVTAEEADADLDSCKEIAWAQESADEKIDTDTAASMGDSSQGAVDTELSQNMSSQRSGKRYGDIVGDCMRQLGYSPAD
jgi:uncharacterized protein YceK